MRRCNSSSLPSAVGAEVAVRGAGAEHPAKIKMKLKSKAIRIGNNSQFVEMILNSVKNIRF